MRLLVHVCEWVNVFAHVLGLGVSLWAFRRCRKTGYALIAIAFLLSVYFLAVRR